MATISPETAAAAAQIDRESLGEKVRVHALAKQLGVRASDFLAVLESNGIEGKKTASTLTKSQVISILDAIAPTPAPKTEAKAPAEKKAGAKKQGAKAEGGPVGEPQESAAERADAAVAEDTEGAGSGDASKSPAKKKATPKKAASKKAAPKKARGTSTTKVAPEEEQVNKEEPGTVDSEQGAQESDSKERGRKGSRGKGQSKATVRSGSRSARGSTNGSDLIDAGAESGSDAGNADAEDGNEVKTGAESGSTSGSGASGTSRRRVRRRVVRRLTTAPATEATRPAGKGAAKAEGDGAGAGGAAGNVAADATEATNHDAADDSSAGKSSSSENSRGESTSGSSRQQPKKPEQLHPAERAEEDVADEPVRFRGSSRLESQRRWHAENRDKNFKAITRSEFLARRESVERSMVVRCSHRADAQGLTTQVGVVEDGMLVEHFVTSENQTSIVGNIYLGQVQSILSGMEAAFINIGTDRNAVLYASDMNWYSPHLRSKTRRMESALKVGDLIMVQVIKDPHGHKGARLTSRISFAGRYLVYFPGGTAAGISRKLPEAERRRLKNILADVIPGSGGAIIRTAAEGAPEEQIADDVARLHGTWERIEAQEKKARGEGANKPITLYEEPDMLIKVVRDQFNEDFSELVVDGDEAWKMVRDYVSRMAPDLKDRLFKWDPKRHGDEDVFAAKGLDEQLAKALSRKVWLPSGGHLVIDHTEAMTVIDVNTGSFVGSGGNLEETVTQNNLEAAEEIVRQMRLRDLGGMIVVDFIDMVLEENQDLVLRRLTEYLGRDRTRHKVGEVTSLGLVQITRKRLGRGLLETFSTTCEACDGRGVILHADPVEHIDEPEQPRRDHGRRKERQQARRQRSNAQENSAQGSSSSSRRHKPAHTDVADIATQALRTAAKEDPDEPSGSDYVADEPAEKNTRAERAESSSSEQRGSRRRRRVVKRVVRSGVEDKGASKANEKRAEERAQDTPERADKSERAEEPAGQRKETAAERSRRMRRVVRKRTTAEAQADAKARASRSGRGAAGSAEGAREREDDTVQAQREFDASPRRKRRTRGNSRSDVRPGGDAPAKDGGTRSTAKAGKTEDAGRAVGAEKAGGRSEASQQGGSRRGRARSRRRRVVRS